MDDLIPNENGTGRCGAGPSDVDDRTLKRVSESPKQTTHVSSAQCSAECASSRERFRTIWSFTVFPSSSIVRILKSTLESQRDREAALKEADDSRHHEDETLFVVGVKVVASGRSASAACPCQQDTAPLGLGIPPSSPRLNGRCLVSPAGQTS